jgi:uncharacterized membrane protein YqjE
MPLLLSSLPAATPVMARHVSAYAELAATDAALLVNALTKRLIAAAVALLGTGFALLMGCVWLVAGVWDTPWRSPTVAALTLLFTALAVAGSLRVSRRSTASPEAFAALREEWSKDRQLLGGPRAGLAQPGGSQTTPQQRLQQTREALQSLAVNGVAEPQSQAFPRSATMRLLLGTGGNGFAAAAAVAGLTGMVTPASRWLLGIIPVAALIRQLWRSRRASGKTGRHPQAQSV